MSTHLPSFEDQEQSFPDGERQFPYILNRRWEVVDKLGQGGMGTVFMAKDLNLPDLTDSKRSCVVKQLRDDFFRDEDREKALQFFTREARVLADLNHPNIVRVLDFFTENHSSFLVMEYVQGKNLHEMLMQRKEPFPEDMVVEWTLQICDVLHYLHTHDPPVIYRDLKPSNIMIDVHDNVKLVDFGIARPFEESEDNTHVVSQGYSPPEQYYGSADPRSDVYSLGCTMHFLLTGEDPAALNVASPKSINPKISSHVDEVVQRSTIQDANGRFQSANEMKEILTFTTKEEDSSSPMRPAVVVGGGILVTAIFLGCLMLFLRLYDQSQMSPSTVSQYEQDALKKQKDKLMQERRAFAKEKREFKFNFLNNNVKKQIGQSSVRKAPKQMNFPIYQDKAELDITDPEGLK